MTRGHDPPICAAAARHAGGGADLLGDLVGLVGGEIHRQLGALRLDEQAHHALIGRPDPEIGLDVALGVDAHPSLLIRCAVLRPAPALGKRAGARAPPGSAAKTAPDPLAFTPARR